MSVRSDKKVDAGGYLPAGVVYTSPEKIIPSGTKPFSNKTENFSPPDIINRKSDIGQ
jgi:hypothetical protein